MISFFTDLDELGKLNIFQIRVLALIDKDIQRQKKIFCQNWSDFNCKVPESSSYNMIN